MYIVHLPLPHLIPSDPVDIGSIVVAGLHEVSEFVDGEESGIILSQVRAGIADREGEVLRYVAPHPTPLPSIVFNIVFFSLVS